MFALNSLLRLHTKLPFSESFANELPDAHVRSEASIDEGKRDLHFGANLRDRCS
jgi:hypothetical protein